LALVLVVGWVAARIFDSPDILLIAGVVAIVQGIVGWYASDTIAIAASGAQPLTREEAPQLHAVVETLALGAHIPMPRLFVIEDGAMNAFATGRDPKHSAIAVTRGLLNNLNKPELEGVLAHEMAHIGNEDIRLMSLVMVLAGTITLLSDWMMRSFWFRDRRSNDSEGGGQLQLLFVVVGIVLLILAPLVASLIQLAISRKREFLADSTAVLITRNPDGLVSALRKISGDPDPLDKANRATAHLYFSNPLHGGFGRLFQTHPPIEERIAAIQAGSGQQTF
jgi:heat shock protein HtpX